MLKGLIPVPMGNSVFPLIHGHRNCIHIIYTTFTLTIINKTKNIDIEDIVLCVSVGNQNALHVYWIEMQLKIVQYV